MRKGSYTIIEYDASTYILRGPREPSSENSSPCSISDRCYRLFVLAVSYNIDYSSIFPYKLYATIFFSILRLQKH